MHVLQIIPRIRVANQTPIYEFTENDQAFPAGMWRWRIQGDIAILERATATDWTTDEDWVAYDKPNEVMRFIKAIATEDGGELTIATGVITATVTKHTVDTEADVATDQLDTINGAGFIGQLLILGSEDDARDIVLRDFNDSGGNIACGGAGATVVLQNVVDRVLLQWDGTYWCVIADSISNAASGSATFSVAAVDSLNPGRADYQCDGTADEVEINAALAALPAAGGRVILMEGTFTLADPIVIPASYITLEGQGWGSFIDGDGLATGEHGIVISSFSYVHIKNLRIQTEDGGGKVCHCIFIEDGANEFVIDRVCIFESDSDGIHIEGTAINKGWIQDCYIEGADGNGIFEDMDAGNMTQNLIIKKNTIHSCGVDGIHFWNTGAADENCIIEGNNIASCGGCGIYIWEGNYFIISGNVIDTVTSYGLRMRAVLYSTIADNMVYQSGASSIMLEDSPTNVVEANYFIDSQAATADGIEVDAGSPDSKILGNYCLDSGRYGVYVLGARSSVSGNTVVRSGDDGMRIRGVEIQVEGNNIYDSGQDAAGTYHGILLNGEADRCQINDNLIDDPGDSTEDGIHLEDGAVECQINDNHIYNLMGDGIILVGNNLDCQITGNTVNQCDDTGIVVADESDRAVVTSNKCFQNGADGIHISESDYCSVTGNVCNTNTDDGIEIEGTATHNADYNTVSSNTCTGNGDDGIVITVAGVGQANHNIIIGNQCVGNTGASLVNGGTNTDLGHNKT